MRGQFLRVGLAQKFPLFSAVGIGATGNRLKDVAFFFAFRAGVQGHLGHLAIIYLAVVEPDRRAYQPMAKIEDDLLTMFGMPEFHPRLENFEGHVG